MYRKLVIRVWLGELPDWHRDWLKHVETLRPLGYDFLLFNDYEEFVTRCKKYLALDVEIKLGTRRAGDFDPALGLIFQDKIEGYDFWGHTGLDTCFGRLDRFLTDEFLSDCDIFGNDPGAICGPFSLYRNEPKINRLFTHSQWKSILGDPSDHIYAFDEGQFSDLVRMEAISGNIRFKTAFWQATDNMSWHKPYPKITLREDGTLYDDAQKCELMMFHFHNYRQWPI